jgi:hypothetical protein
MQPAGNSYNDTTNTMNVGPINGCVSGSDGTTHTHLAQLVVQNVRDLVGWQARLNYIGDKMRPQSHNPAPFVDNTTAQAVGFANLPIDQATLDHRNISPASAIPPAPPDNSNTPQTALIGASYIGTQTFAISPDTPPKSVPDDTSYSAPSGGVLTQLTVEVVGNETGQSLVIDVDDNSPNAPGSTIIFFTGSGIQQIDLGEVALGDGQHVEGGLCP